MSELKQCDLCGRQVGEVTRHHLIPRTRHANKRNKREFNRVDVKQRLAWLCRPCHKQVHALFEEKTLERQFNTIEKLAEHPEIKKFIEWVQKKPPSAHVTVMSSKRKR